MTGIKKISLLILAVAAIPSTFALSAEAQNPTDNLSVQDCDCHHNGDAGRWNDSDKPSERVKDLCSRAPACYQAIKGRMCVSGDQGKCDCAVQAAQDWESWHDDWFLWSSITCGGLSITIT